MEAAINQLDANVVVSILKGQIAMCSDNTPDVEKQKLLKLKDLFQKCSNVVNTLLHEENNKPIDLINDESAVPCLSIENVQFLEPRGRFNTNIDTIGIRISGKSGSCFIDWGNLANVSFVSSSYSTKKEGEDLLAIQLDKPILLDGKKSIKYFVWILNRTSNLSVVNPKPVSGDYNFLFSN